MLILQAVTHPSIPSQQEIANILRISQPAVSKQLSKLIEMGMGEGVKIDNRTWQLKLSNNGKQELESAFTAYDNFCNQVFSALSKTDKQLLNKSLLKLQLNLQ
jgi:DNA-binding MarR family transcriptional regulator